MEQCRVNEGKNVISARTGYGKHYGYDDYAMEISLCALELESARVRAKLAAAK